MKKLIYFNPKICFLQELFSLVIANGEALDLLYVLLVDLLLPYNEPNDHRNANDKQHQKKGHKPDIWVVGVVNLVYKAAEGHIVRIGVLVCCGLLEVGNVALVVVVLVLVLAVVDVLSVVVHPHIKVSISVYELPYYLGGDFRARVAVCRLGSGSQILLDAGAVHYRDLGEQGVQGVVMGRIVGEFKREGFVCRVVD